MELKKKSIKCEEFHGNEIEIESFEEEKMLSVSAIQTPCGDWSIFGFHLHTTKTVQITVNFLFTRASNVCAWAR